MFRYLKPHLWLAAQLESVSFDSKVTFLSNNNPKPVLHSICCCFSYLHPSVVSGDDLDMKSFVWKAWSSNDVSDD